jgi:hypothetical protein
MQDGFCCLTEGEIVRYFSFSDFRQSGGRNSLSPLLAEKPERREK